jgi:hypothetical protein
MSLLRSPFACGHSHKSDWLSSLQGQLGPGFGIVLLWMLIARWKVEARYTY